MIETDPVVTQTISEEMSAPRFIVAQPNGSIQISNFDQLREREKKDLIASIDKIVGEFMAKHAV